MKIKLTDPNVVSEYTSSTGMFVVITSTNEIYWTGRCRVELEWYLKKNNYHNRIGFKKSNADIKLMRSFWSKIFKKLGKKSKFTICKSTVKNFTVNDIYVIDLPEFWNTETNRSLFSLFLRASVCYHTKGNGVIKTLKSYYLANNVIPAIEWFLKGNTIPTYEKFTTLDGEGYTGFVAEFQHLTQSEIEKKLISKIPAQ